LLAIFACLSQSLVRAQVVQLTNLTHPAISPNFVAGDQFQLVVQGAPNQPVSVLQNTNGSIGTLSRLEIQMAMVIS